VNESAGRWASKQHRNLLNSNYKTLHTSPLIEKDWLLLRITRGLTR
jgi:hypothetical protein